jgi:hypothetical protein
MLDVPKMWQNERLQQLEDCQKGPRQTFQNWYNVVSFVSSKTLMKQSIQRMRFAYVYDQG